jgi:anti-sigma-K factor RskA
MKKTFRSILAGALALLAVSCYDDSALRTAISALESRVAELETKLNTEVTTLNSKIDGLDAAYKLADANLSAELTASVNAAVQTLTQKLDALDGALDGYLAAYEADKATVQQSIAGLLAADDSLNAALAAAVAELKAADSNFKMSVDELSAALVSINVTSITKNQAGNAVITFVDKSTLEIPVKPQEGLVTVLETDGVKYWAVISNGVPKSLGVKVGHSDLKFKVDAESQVLYFSVDGGANWESTDVVIEEGQECLLTSFYQGVTDEYDPETYEPIKEDFYTLVFADETYYLPIYKVDNSVVACSDGLRTLKAPLKFNLELF